MSTLYDMVGGWGGRMERTSARQCDLVFPGACVCLVCLLRLFVRNCLCPTNPSAHSTAPQAVAKHPLGTRLRPQAASAAARRHQLGEETHLAFGAPHTAAQLPEGTL